MKNLTLKYQIPASHLYREAGIFFTRRFMKQLPVPETHTPERGKSYQAQLDKLAGITADSTNGGWSVIIEWT